MGQYGSVPHASIDTNKKVWHAKQYTATDLSMAMAISVKTEAEMVSGAVRVDRRHKTAPNGQLDESM